MRKTQPMFVQFQVMVAGDNRAAMFGLDKIGQIWTYVFETQQWMKFEEYIMGVKKGGPSGPTPSKADQV